TRGGGAVARAGAPDAYPGVRGKNPGDPRGDELAGKYPGNARKPRSGGSAALPVRGSMPQGIRGRQSGHALGDAATGPDLLEPGRGGASGGVGQPGPRRRPPAPGSSSRVDPGSPRGPGGRLPVAGSTRRGGQAARRTPGRAAEGSGNRPACRGR